MRFRVKKIQPVMRALGTRIEGGGEFTDHNYVEYYVEH